MLRGLFAGDGLGPLVPLEKRVTANQYKVVLSDHLYPAMKHFYPERFLQRNNGGIEGGR